MICIPSSGVQNYLLAFFIEVLLQRLVHHFSRPSPGWPRKRPLDGRRTRKQLDWMGLMRMSFLKHSSLLRLDVIASDIAPFCQVPVDWKSMLHCQNCIDQTAPNILLGTHQFLDMTWPPNTSSVNPKRQDLEELGEGEEDGGLPAHLEVDPQEGWEIIRTKWCQWWFRSVKQRIPYHQKCSVLLLMYFCNADGSFWKGTVPRARWQGVEQENYYVDWVQ